MKLSKTVGVLAWLVFVLVVAALPSAAAENPADKASDWKVDHRYAPVWWQTSICLPDDWQKTLVGKEGTLLYDFPGKFSGFKTRIGIDYGSGGQAFLPVKPGGQAFLPVKPEAKWLRQELVSPRVPIVRTIKQLGKVEIVEEAFAIGVEIDPGIKALFEKDAKAAQAAKPAVERVDRGGTNQNWAHPKVPCDPAYRDIAVAMGGSVQYRIRAAAGEKYTVVLGLCEGWHPKPGQRVLDLRIEGKNRKTVDMVAEHGRNMPILFPFEARDEDGDGWIDVTIAAASGSPDRNTILNVLWAFQGDAPPVAELLTGKSSRPVLAYVRCGSGTQPSGPPRYDVIRVQLRNSGDAEVSVLPVITIDSELSVTVSPQQRRIEIGGATYLYLTATELFGGVSGEKQKTVVRLKPVKVPARQDQIVAIGALRGVPLAEDRQLMPRTADWANNARRLAEQYWQKLDLPYGRFEIPDPGIQATLDSSIRNIYQAREIKNALPAFQVGPTCYRGLWVVDGSFLMEAVAMLGRTDEARNGIRYLLSFQRPDGAIMLIDGHLKETGIALWAVTRHARLTNDPKWLAEVWPQVEKGFAYIRTLRQKASADPKALVYGLLPEGFSDGGLGGVNPEYTNVYWTLAGMKAAVDGARWLGKNQQAQAWQREYDDFYAAFRRAAERDARIDPRGNRYVPISMRKDAKLSPQKAQWAFLHAVFPGKVFAANDPLVVGNMAMLRAVEAEGLVRDTGWISNGVWNYFASFYAHGWLWTGDGQKAARTLYDFANHASPLLCWREEQMPRGEGDAVCGDMPHNWASAEFIRLVRDLLVLERGDELHLLEGLPRAWVQPGKAVRASGVLTEFGPISLELRIAADGSKATLTLDPPARNPAKRIVVHLDGWSGSRGTIELPAKDRVVREIPLKKPNRA